MTSYAPFPEAELLQVAEFHESAAKAFPERGYMRGVCEERASVCRAAVAAHIALRERFLEQSMRVRELEAPITKEAA